MSKLTNLMCCFVIDIYKKIINKLPTYDHFENLKDHLKSM